MKYVADALNTVAATQYRYDHSAVSGDACTLQRTLWLPS
jgi:hypothetical protein